MDEPRAQDFASDPGYYRNITVAIVPREASSHGVSQQCSLPSRGQISLFSLKETQLFSHVHCRGAVSSFRKRIRNVEHDYSRHDILRRFPHRQPISWFARVHRSPAIAFGSCSAPSIELQMGCQTYSSCHHLGNAQMVSRGQKPAWLAASGNRIRGRSRIVDSSRNEVLESPSTVGHY